MSVAPEQHPTGGWEQPPNRAEASATGAGAGGFWVVPGVDGPNRAQVAPPGSTPVGSYQPPDSTRVVEVLGLVDQLGDVSELVAVLAGTARVLGAQLGPGGACDPGLGSAPGVLDDLVGLVQVGNTVNGCVSELVGAVDRAGVAPVSAGLSTWLVLKAHLTRSQASRLVLGARDVGRLGLVRRAALDGLVNRFQVEAITTGLKGVVGGLSQTQVDQVEQLLVEAATGRASDGLGRLVEDVLEQVAPDIAQEVAEVKAGRQLARARSRAFFKVTDNGDGSASLKGLLPSAQAEQVRGVVDRVAEKARRQLAAAPGGVAPSRDQARALALVGLCAHVRACGQATALGGTGARLVITVNAADLPTTNTNTGTGTSNTTTGAGGADPGGSDTDPGGSGTDPGGGVGWARPGSARPGLVGRLATTGQRVPAGEFARLVCDCEVMRVVLAAKSEILDVGRVTRVVPRGLRTALVIRDGGCCFPGCDRPPEVCEAHHVRPWYAGGPTNLSNLVLLCPYHHRLVEPPRVGPPDWQPVKQPDGRFAFKPPAWLDPGREPIHHHRHGRPKAETTGQTTGQTDDTG